MSETKKNSLLLTNVDDFYVLEDKTSKKNVRLNLILILNTILISTKTLRSDTKFGGYL